MVAWFDCLLVSLTAQGKSDVANRLAWNELQLWSISWQLQTLLKPSDIENG